jgi:hypothetical protein
LHVYCAGVFDAYIYISFKDGYRRALNESNGRWRKHRWITFIAALRIVILHSRAITYLFSVFMTFISVYLLFQPTNKAVLASIVIVLLPLAIVQGLGVVLVIGKALNVKDIFDVLFGVKLFHDKTFLMRVQQKIKV